MAALLAGARTSSDVRTGAARATPAAAKSATAALSETVSFENIMSPLPGMSRRIGLRGAVPSSSPVGLASGARPRRKRSVTRRRFGWQDLGREDSQRRPTKAAFRPRLRDTRTDPHYPEPPFALDRCRKPVTFARGSASGSGDWPGLQNRWRALRGVLGGFDSHALPPPKT